MLNSAFPQAIVTLRESDGRLRCYKRAAWIMQRNRRRQRRFLLTWLVRYANSSDSLHELLTMLGGAGPM